MKITPIQQYVILGIFIFGAIVLAYYQFWLKPMNKQIVELSGTLEQKQKELKEAQRIAKQYIEFKKRADSIQRELEWLQSRVPKTIDRAKMLEAINFVQSRSGVILTNLQFSGTPVTKDANIEIPATVKFNGSFKSLLDFLYQATLVNLFITVKDITINALPPSPLNSSNPNMTLSAQMTLSGVESK